MSRDVHFLDQMELCIVATGPDPTATEMELRTEPRMKKR